MALNKERYHLTGTPRVYCDLVQYFKAIGKQTMTKRSWANSNQFYPSQTPDNWGMNPSRIIPREILNVGVNENGVKLEDIIVFGEEVDVIDNDPFVVEPVSKELRKLMYSVNYFGILGHNIASLNFDAFQKIELQYQYDDESFTGLSTYTPVIASFDGSNVGADGDGTFLATCSGWNPSATPDNARGFRIINYLAGDSVDMQIGNSLEIGSYTLGHYYDFPHSPNMEVSISYGFDGIKRTRTMNGTDLIQINYLKSKWGKYAPFATSTGYDKQALPDVGLKGRRTIDMNFDFLSESDTFPKNIHQNTFVQDTYADADGHYAGFDYDEDGHNTNILGNYLNMTLGGNLTHILQLDSTAHDFMLVKLDGSGTSITQKSPKLYSCRLRFVEQF